MAKRDPAAAIPSPCIDVCKYKRRGHCIGCGMTEAQKRSFKGLADPTARRALLDEILAQQADLGGMRGWPLAYARKCMKAGVPNPLDD